MLLLALAVSQASSKSSYNYLRSTNDYVQIDMKEGDFYEIFATKEFIVLALQESPKASVDVYVSDVYESDYVIEDSFLTTTRKTAFKVENKYMKLVVRAEEAGTLAYSYFQYSFLSKPCDEIFLSTAPSILFRFPNTSTVAPNTVHCFFYLTPWSSESDVSLLSLNKGKLTSYSQSIPTVIGTHSETIQRTYRNPLLLTYVPNQLITSEVYNVHSVSKTRSFSTSGTFPSGNYSFLMRDIVIPGPPDGGHHSLLLTLTYVLLAIFVCGIIVSCAFCFICPDFRARRNALLEDSSASASSHDDNKLRHKNTLITPIQPTEFPLQQQPLMPPPAQMLNSSVIVEASVHSPYGI